LLAQEELYFVAERNTVAYRDEDGNRLEILAGEIINTNAAVLYGQVHIGSDLHLVIRFGDPDIHWTFAKHFRPVNTEDVFGEDIFIEHPGDRFDPSIPSASGFYVVMGDVEAMWVPYYYADILMGQTRDRLLEIHPSLESFSYREIMWNESSEVNIRLGRAMFYNSVIMLDAARFFAVRNIRKTDFGYVVDCVVSTHGYAWLERPERDEALWTPFWGTYWLGDTVILFLHLDGDYLDIYTADSNIHLGTFIRVGREFIRQYQSLIRTNISDLTNVQWPQRAEGSTGIPPVFVVPDNFRNETLEVTDEPVNNDFEDQENAFVQQNDDVSSIPLWVWLAIICGVVVIVALAVMLFVRRKR